MTTTAIAAPAHTTTSHSARDEQASICPRSRHWDLLANEERAWCGEIVTVPAGVDQLDALNAHHDDCRECQDIADDLDR